MNSMVKWLENAPIWLKVIFALPVLDIVWAIFRIVKGIAKKDYGLVLVGVLWILLGWAILWIVDLISILINKHPILA